MPLDSSCLFCKIVNKEINAKIIAENDLALAFQDINPQAPIHALIAPKLHIDSIQNLHGSAADVMVSLMLLAQEIAQGFCVADDGYRLVINHGILAGQSVHHLHMHFLAGRVLSWPPG